MVKVIPSNVKNEDQTLRKHQNCIFLHNAMETTGVHQGMIIMLSCMMDTIFHTESIVVMHGTLCHKIER